MTTDHTNDGAQQDATTNAAPTAPALPTPDAAPTPTALPTIPAATKVEAELPVATAVLAETATPLPPVTETATIAATTDPAATAEAAAATTAAKSGWAEAREAMSTIGEGLMTLVVTIFSLIARFFPFVESPIFRRSVSAVAWATTFGFLCYSYGWWALIMVVVLYAVTCFQLLGLPKKKA